jgi:hypothetical protein
MPMGARLLRHGTAVTVACVSILAASFTASVGTQAAGLAPKPLGGINISGIAPGESFAQIDREIATAKALHAQVVRTEIPWSAFEPKSPGVVEPAAIAAANRLMSDAAKANIKVIALVDSTPCWASTAPASLLASCSGGQASTANAWPPREASAFGAFAGWLASQYGEQLAAIEIWNEPDQANQDYLAGPDKPQHYAELLRAAYPAIKRADSNIVVLAGSLVGSNGGFMRALYAQGVKGYYDAVSVHFYNLVLGSVRRFHEVQVENGDRTPLWLDEFGWSSCWPARKIEQEQGCVSKSVQAQNITSSFRELARAPYLAALLTYGFQDHSGEEFGVLNAQGKRKPSFYALAGVLGSPLEAPAPVTLRLRRSSGHVIASGSAPVGDYMRLEAFLHGVLRYRAIFTLNRFNDYSIALPSVLGTRDLRVRVYQYWLGAGSDAQSKI